MKVRGLEGSPQEIHDLFKNNGMDLSNYISAPMKAIWLVIPIVVSVIVLMVIVFGQVSYPSFGAKCLPVALILQLVCVVWLVASVQLKFESVTTTVVLSISCLLLLAIVAGMMSISDALKLIQSFKGG